MSEIRKRALTQREWQTQKVVDDYVTKAETIQQRKKAREGSLQEQQALRQRKHAEQKQRQASVIQELQAAELKKRDKFLRGQTDLQDIYEAEHPSVRTAPVESVANK